MEKLTNCNLVIDIKTIDNIHICTDDHSVHVFAVLSDLTKCRVEFRHVWDFRFSVENATIDRFSKVERRVTKNSSVLTMENSEYIRYFEKQSSGTLPINELKEYIVVDKTDPVISILSLEEPSVSRF